MQRAFAEWAAMRLDWAQQQAAARAKILSDRYPLVKDDFEIEEVSIPAISPFNLITLICKGSSYLEVMAVRLRA